MAARISKVLMLAWSWLPKSQNSALSVYK